MYVIHEGSLFLASLVDADKYEAADLEKHFPTLIHKMPVIFLIA